MRQGVNGASKWRNGYSSGIIACVTALFIDGGAVSAWVFLRGVERVFQR
jgi:hypothetical protein